MWVELEDGRTLGSSACLVSAPAAAARLAQREALILSPDGLHWEELDEDISIAGLLAGRGDMTRARTKAA